jgi:GAF domain-containing protein
MVQTGLDREAGMTRAGTARRLHGLFEAHRTIISDLSLSATLHRIVAAACDLVGAHYGALAVLDAGNSFEQLVHQGMDERIVDQLSGQPTRGLLSELAASPRPLRIDAVPLDSDAGVFLAQESTRGAFLGVQVRVRGEMFGLLYLAEPQGAAFNAEDEELLAAFAAAAGTAIENARLYDDSRRSRDWLNAAGEIARALLADADENALLEVVSRALYVAEADYGSLILPTQDGRLEVAVVVGLGAQEWQGHVFDPQQSEVGRAIARGESRLIRDLTELASPGYENVHHYGPAMLAPLIDAQGVRGAVMLIRGSERRGFTAKELDMASTFADQVALAFQLNDARADAESLRALEDRHRIAQELHDNVMQRLFAIGVGLDGVAHSHLPSDVVDRLRGYVSELDATIDEIRDRVFGLRSETAAGLVRAPHRFPRVSPPPTAS